FRENSVYQKMRNKMENENASEYITIDDFCKVQLKVGEVLASEKVEKSNKLLKNTVKIGDEVRTILSGIAKFYTPEEMVGKKVVVVTNLKPRVMCGFESCGMILCASEGDKLTLISPEKLIESGAEVC
ncbi:MAG: methionine--tRNA ligase subunit beta, partial [Candidatus Neoclostridium sp.]